MGRLTDALRKLGYKMTGKAIAPSKTVSTIVEDIAKGYSAASIDYVNSLMSGALKRVITNKLPSTDIDNNTIYMVRYANILSTFGTEGDYKETLHDALVYSHLVEGTDYVDNGVDNTQFKNNTVLKIRVQPTGKVVLTGYPNYSSYTFTVNGVESSVLTGTNESAIAAYEQDILITAKSSNNYYKSINVYPASSSPSNIYVEYMYINNAWELIGTTAVSNVQEQADWNEADNTKASFIKNKPTIPTMPHLYRHNIIIDFEVAGDTRIAYAEYYSNSNVTVTLQELYEKNVLFTISPLNALTNTIYGLGELQTEINTNYSFDLNNGDDTLRPDADISIKNYTPIQIF